MEDIGNYGYTLFRTIPRNRKGRLSESEVMTILICYHFGTYRSFKEYYQNCIRGCFHKEFPPCSIL